MHRSKMRRARPASDERGRTGDGRGGLGRGGSGRRADGSTVVSDEHWDRPTRTADLDSRRARSSIRRAIRCCRRLGRQDTTRPAGGGSMPVLRAGASFAAGLAQDDRDMIVVDDDRAESPAPVGRPRRSEYRQLFSTLRNKRMHGTNATSPEEPRSPFGTAACAAAIRRGNIKPSLNAQRRICRPWRVEALRFARRAREPLWEPSI